MDKFVFGWTEVIPFCNESLPIMETNDFVSDHTIHTIKIKIENYIIFEMKKTTSQSANKEGFIKTD